MMMDFGSLRRLPKLAYLNLAKNRLSGEIPSDLGLLTDMRVGDLDFEGAGFFQEQGLAALDVNRI